MLFLFSVFIDFLIPLPLLAITYNRTPPYNPCPTWPLSSWTLTLLLIIGHLPRFPKNAVTTFANFTFVIMLVDSKSLRLTFIK